MAAIIDNLQSVGNGLSGVLIGAAIGIYATIVFQRYTKFKDVVADLAYRVTTIGEQVEQIDQERYNPAQLWVAASSVIRDHIHPCYFALAVYGHHEAKKNLDTQLNQILEDLFKISDDVAKRSENDWELAQVGGNRPFWVKIQWGFHLNRFRDLWTLRMMKLEPNWAVIFGGTWERAPQENSNVI